MILNAKEIIKLMLSREGMKQKDMAEILTKKTGKRYTAGSLSQKINRRTISYDEVILIADILGYDLNLQRRENI